MCERLLTTHAACPALLEGQKIIMVQTRAVGRFEAVCLSSMTIVEGQLLKLHLDFDPAGIRYMKPRRRSYQIVATTPGEQPFQTNHVPRKNVGPECPRT